MTLPLEVTSGWEHRFPDLFGKWTHWKIVEDSYCIAIIHGANLAEAMRVIEDNYGKYSSIKACRARFDENGNVIDEQKRSLYEISNYSNDEKLRKRHQGE